MDGTSVWDVPPRPSEATWALQEMIEKDERVQQGRD
jgi:hypothetical protein